LRIGTEIIITFPLERVLTALPPIAEGENNIQSQAQAEPLSARLDDAALRPKRFASGAGG
jgi:hypothetical protein